MKRNEYGLSPKDYAKLFDVHRHMIDRCYKSNSCSYENYGARGIKVCDEWKNNKHSFFKWAIENGWMPGLTIERTDVNGNYCPENCTFITRYEQSINKTDTAWITYHGETKPMSVWCDELHLNRSSVITRRSRGAKTGEELFFKGHKNDFGRVIEKRDLDGNLIETFTNANDAGKSIGVSNSAIHNCCRGRCKTTGGYKWNYKFLN